MSSVFRAPFFSSPIEEEDIEIAEQKLKDILELAEHENDWIDISSDEDDDVEPDEQNDEFVVEKVLGEKVDKGKLKFLVKWFGYDLVKDQTWEPLEHFLTKGSKLAIFLFYKEKWQKIQMKAGTSGENQNNNAVELDEQLTDDDDNDDEENLPPPRKRNSNSSKNVPREERPQTSSSAASAKHPSKPSKPRREETIPSASKSAAAPKRIRPAPLFKVRAKLFKSSYQNDGLYFNKEELQRKRELQQKQAEERAVEKKLQEKREAERRAREEAEEEKRKILEKARELREKETRAKVLADLGDSDEEEENDAEEDDNE